MGKKQVWKPGTMVYPLPAVLVGCGSNPDDYNLLTVAWVGTICTNPPMCYISVRPERHSYELIKRNMEFTINLTSREMAFAAENPVEHPSFNTGDTVSVHYKIVEGNKERIQVFRGVVIQVKGTGSTKTFTVRKMSGNVGVERIFPIESPFIKEIEVNKVGKVRRARIYYFRNLTGKKAKIKEKRS